MRRNVLFHLLLAGSLMVLSSACEHEIAFDYPESDAQVVFNGRISNEGVSVQISRTRPMSDSTLNHFISDAQVWIAADDGSEEQLSFDRQRQCYSSPTGLVGQPGRAYTMRAVVDGQRYEATSTMLPATTVDSIYFRWIEVLKKRIYFVCIKGSNALPGQRNYCLLRLFRGDELFRWTPHSGRSSTDDRYEYDLVCSSEDDINKGIDDDGKIPLRDGDSLRAEVISIDRTAWEFYHSLSYGQASTSNALSNIRGGAQGVFMACSITRPDTIVFRRDSIQ